LPDTDGQLDGGRRPPVAGIEANEGAIVVRLAGELDLYNVDEVRDALIEACRRRPDRVVVDLSEVEFMDSTALGALIEAERQVAQTNGFALAAPGLQARRALETSGLDRHFSVHDSLQEALDAGV
jgi:anti-sigma B factor antagonist